MALEFSPIITAKRKVHSDGFTYLNLSERFFGGLIDPILTLDFFRMSEPTGPSRPLAGFSAATYLLERSAGRLETRDSRSPEKVVIGPGGFRWTHSGNGIIHEEQPVGREVCEGIHLSVNLPSAHKRSEPWTKILASAEVKEWKPNPSLRGRALVGKLAGAVSPIVSPSPFSFFEFTMKPKMSVSPRVLSESGGLVFALQGKLRISSSDDVLVFDGNQAVGFRNAEKDAELFIEALDSPEGEAHFLFLSGKACKEPFIAHGPFVMNTQAEIEAAIARYQRGEMGELRPS
jgi:redox-sensitive bicupin YhaK (pirin superfamily)